MFKQIEILIRVGHKVFHKDTINGELIDVCLCGIPWTHLGKESQNGIPHVHPCCHLLSGKSPCPEGMPIPHSEVAQRRFPGR